MNEEMNNNYNSAPNYNYEKKNNRVKVLLVVLIVLVVCLIGLLSYKLFVVDKKNDNRKDNNVENDKTGENNSDNEKDNNTISTYIDELKRLNYKILIDDNNIYYLEKNGDSYKVKHELNNATYIGIHNNRLYFQDFSKEGYASIKYMDINNSEKIIKEWLEIKRPKCTGVCVGDSISNAVFSNDTMYFDIGYEPADEKSGVLTLKYNDTRFNDFKQLIKEVDLGKWNLDEKQERIFYVGSLYEPSMNDMYVYDLSKKDTIKILENLVSLDYRYDNNKILYRNNEIGTTPNVYNVNKLSLYDVNTKKDITLTNKFQKLGLNAQFVGNYIYYLENNGIIYQYDILKNQTNKYYDMKHINDYDSFEFITPNLMKINLWEQSTGSNIKYYFKQNEVDFDGTLPVTMLNGTIKNFNISDFIE